MNLRDAVGPTIFSNRFGSLKEAINRAGLKTSNHAMRYTEDECFQNMFDVWTYHGRSPNYKEMNVPPSKVGPKAYIQRWGTWRGALRAFVSKMDSRQSEEKFDDRRAVEPAVEKMPVLKKETPKEEDKREIRLGLRFRVLKRDQFKCVLCGRSPANHPGLELHVDHIIPFSKGGKTIEENLRTTCAGCNLGKGTKLD